MKFLKCIAYYAALGIVSFIAGRLISGHSFNYEAFPFKSRGFEKGGLVYKRLGVHKWQNLVPDMSRIFKKIMPPKKLIGRPDKKQLLTLINETCIAELIHTLLSIFALGSLWIWKGLGGFIVWLVYFIGNLPYIIIQRYNRPRFIKLLRMSR